LIRGRTNNLPSPPTSPSPPPPQPTVDTWAVGDPAQVAHQLREAAAEFGVDEIMVHPVQGAYQDDPADAWPAKVRGFELLAEQLLDD
ncbi:hypothetical protein ACPCG0_00345, partial [Propionibacteriaceae bacterium Y1923]